MAPDPFTTLRTGPDPDRNAPAVPSMAELDRLVRRRRLRGAGLLVGGASVLALGLSVLLLRPVPSDAGLARDAAVGASIGEVVQSLDSLLQPRGDDLPNAELVAMLDPFASSEDPVQDPLAGVWPEGDL